MSALATAAFLFLSFGPRDADKPRICPPVKQDNNGLPLHQTDLNCVVDANCAGNWNVPKAEDPDLIKFCCSIVVTLGTSPVL